MDTVITVYTDYKSPYAYLAKDPTYALARDYRVTLQWHPYILDIPSYLGSAQVDDTGRVLQEERNPHQWRRVRYSYMDCRRQAQKQGLVIRGTRKIWDSSLAAAGMLHVQQSGEDVFRRYHDMVFERFWKRALDIESMDAIIEIITTVGGDAATFSTGHLALRSRVAEIAREAEATGVFGVPSFVVDGALFWGREHLPDIAATLEPRRTLSG